LHAFRRTHPGRRLRRADRRLARRRAPDFGLCHRWRNHARRDRPEPSAEAPRRRLRRVPLGRPACAKQPARAGKERLGSQRRRRDHGEPQQHHHHAGLSCRPAAQGPASAGPFFHAGRRLPPTPPCAKRPPRPMDALLSSTVLVALAEIGDKTQLLALVLAARFRKPAPIVAGILVATLANHALAAWLGASAAAWLEGPWFGAAVAVGFIAMGLWTLVPDKLDEDEAPPSGRTAFRTPPGSFFLGEDGDKTQNAANPVRARYGDVPAVTAGTTPGLLPANPPGLFAGDALIRRVPVQAVRFAA